MLRRLRVCKECGLEAFTEKDLNKFCKDRRRKNEHIDLCRDCYNKRRQKTMSTHERRKREFIKLWGPHPLCYFCGEEITKFEGRDTKSLAIHSLDGNHDNWDPSNKVPSHMRCHSIYHAKGPKGTRRIKASITLEKELLEWMDEKIKMGVYASHSHAIRFALIQLMRAP